MTEKENTALENKSKAAQRCAAPITFTGEELLNEPFNPMSFVVDEMLTGGVFILAGAPKIGKSWLVLWICSCVATGNPLWNFKTQQSMVLYYCLEDNKDRIHKRFLEIAAESDDDYSYLHFSLEARKLNEGLDREIESFVDLYPDTRLVVIDTLQKVRGISDCTYSNDYTDLAKLKEIADRLGICIVVVHHTRKQKDSDPMNTISGTTGITGAADGSFVLSKESRDSNYATLSCTGRDIETRELSLVYDTESCVWQLLHDSITDDPEPTDEIVSSVYKLLEYEPSFIGTATELAERLSSVCGGEYKPSLLSKRLIKAHDALARLGIRYEYKRTREKRTIMLELPYDDGSDGSDAECVDGLFPVTSVTAVTTVTGSIDEERVG